MICSIVLNTGWLSGKETTYNAGATGNMGSICGPGRSPGKGNDNSLQYFCWKKSHGQRSLGLGEAIVHRAAKIWTRLSTAPISTIYAIFKRQFRFKTP